MGLTHGKVVWACRVDPRYHGVLAVKVCALAGERLRPAAVCEP